MIIVTGSCQRLRRRRHSLGGITVVGAGLLGASLSARPGSPSFYVLTAGTAVAWAGGALAVAPLELGGFRTVGRTVLFPVASGVGAFGAFYLGALLARRMPVLDDALPGILRFAEEGSSPLVAITTLANGVAEEMFFRGALYGTLEHHRALPGSVTVYILATTATRNPALVLASAAMGVLFGLLRRWSGGVLAPALAHVTWSGLMLRYLPPLVRDLQATTDKRRGREPHG